MNTNIEKFLEKLANDETLRQELAEAEKNIAMKDPKIGFNEILRPIINKAGFDFSFEDLQKTQNKLDDDFLDQVSGGKKKGMACVIIGGGNSNCFGFGVGEGKNGKTCMCIFGGGGKF